MKILLSVHGYPPTHTAGAERQTERMANWLAAHNHDVSILAIESVSANKYSLETRREGPITVHRVSYNIHDGDYFRNLYDAAVIGQAMETILKAESFDLMHQISGYLMGGQTVHTARKHNIPVVISPMEYWFLCSRLNLIQSTNMLCSGPESDQKCARCLLEEKRRYRLPAQHLPGLADMFWSAAQQVGFGSEMERQVAVRRETLAGVLDAANLVVCNSQFLIEKFAEYNHDVSRFVHIRQGLAAFPPEANQKTTTTQPLLRLGYIGQIQPHKGVHLLVDAVLSLLQENHAVSLDIWGNQTQDPAYTDELKQRAADYPAIRWRGTYTATEVWDVIAGFDVAVVPSSWYENSPNVLLEAFAMKRPAIATNLGGMAELVEHGQSGLLFALNDVDDLRLQIKRLLQEPGLLPHLQANIPAVKTVDDEMEELITHYHRILSG